MAFQSVPDTIEVDFNMSYKTIPIQNTFYVKVAGADYTQGSAEDLGSALAAWFAATYVDRLPADLVGVNITLRGLENANDFLVIDTDIAGEPGVRTNDFPNNVAWAVRRNSGLTGRSARGRVFWPIASADRNASSENFVDATSAAAIVAILNLFESAAQGAVASATEVIVSRFSGGVKRTTGITFPVVNYSYSDLKFDTMRGRLG